MTIMSDNEFKLMANAFAVFTRLLWMSKTGGFNEKKDALLEIGAVTQSMI